MNKNQVKNSRIKSYVLTLITSLFFLPSILLPLHAMGADMLSASGQKKYLYSFEFAMKDSPGIELIDYLYGDPHGYAIKNHGLNGTCFQHDARGGYFPKGKKLYAKWRIKDTGEILEDSINLEGKLPDDLTGYIITFRIEGSHLIAYLITPEHNSGGEVIPELHRYRNKKIVVLNPTQS